jgi:hypothetical protein
MMQREKSIPNKSIKRIIPTARDVVLGRGRGNDLRRGNVAFRKLIREHRSSYLESGRRIKHSIAELVLAKVIGSGGQFLKKDRGFHIICFHIVSLKQAMEKIKQALREKQTNKIPAAPQRTIVAQEEITIKVVKPTTRDVITDCGQRSSPLYDNVAFHRLIETHRSAYQAADFQLKLSIAKLVMDQVIDSGGRFLRANSHGEAFHTLSLGEAWEMITRALREKPKLLPAPQRTSVAQNGIKIKVVEPTTHDVITGRGQRVGLHCGNVAFRQLIETHRLAYQVADSRLKLSIAKKVMDQVIDSGGRFLKVNNHGDGFRIMSRRQAREKIAGALRKQPTQKLLGAPRRKSVAQNGITTKCGVVEKEAVAQLLQLKKEDASPIDLYLHEAIKVLDDDSDDDSRSAASMTSRDIIPAATAHYIPIQATTAEGQILHKSNTVPTIHCPFLGPNVCSTCRFAFFPLASFVAPMAGPASYTPAPCREASSGQQNHNEAV